MCCRPDPEGAGGSLRSGCVGRGPMGSNPPVVGARHFGCYRSHRPRAWERGAERPTLEILPSLSRSALARDGQPRHACCHQRRPDPGRTPPWWRGWFARYSVRGRSPLDASLGRGPERLGGALQSQMAQCHLCSQRPSGGRRGRLESGHCQCRSDPQMSACVARGSRGCSRSAAVVRWGLLVGVWFPRWPCSICVS